MQDEGATVPEATVAFHDKVLTSSNDSALPGFAPKAKIRDTKHRHTLFLIQHLDNLKSTTKSRICLRTSSGKYFYPFSVEAYYSRLCFCFKRVSIQ